MAILIIVNAGPYGSETTYNALRLALSLRRQTPDSALKILLLGDDVGCALPRQRTPSGYYNLERTIRHLTDSGTKVGTCLTCMEARGLTSLELSDGVEPSNVDELAEWIQAADKALCF